MHVHISSVFADLDESNISEVFFLINKVGTMYLSGQKIAINCTKIHHFVCTNLTHQGGGPTLPPGRGPHPAPTPHYKPHSL